MNEVKIPENNISILEAMRDLDKGKLTQEEYEELEAKEEAQNEAVKRTYLEILTAENFSAVKIDKPSFGVYHIIGRNMSEDRELYPYRIWDIGKRGGDEPLGHRIYRTAEELISREYLCNMADLYALVC